MDTPIYEGYEETFMDYPYTTHSIIRAKERAGLNKRKAAKMIEIAKTRGIRSKDCTWSVDRKFLDNRSTDTSIAIAYNGFCFIFDREMVKCITMFRLPKSFGKKKTYYKADTRKYRNCVDDYAYEEDYDEKYNKKKDIDKSSGKRSIFAE